MHIGCEYLDDRTIQMEAPEDDGTLGSLGQLGLFGKVFKTIGKVASAPHRLTASVVGKVPIVGKALASPFKFSANVIQRPGRTLMNVARAVPKAGVSFVTATVVSGNPMVGIAAAGYTGVRAGAKKGKQKISLKETVLKGAGQGALIGGGATMLGFGKAGGLLPQITSSLTRVPKKALIGGAAVVGVAAVGSMTDKRSAERPIGNLREVGRVRREDRYRQPYPEVAQAGILSMMDSPLVSVVIIGGLGLITYSFMNR